MWLVVANFSVLESFVFAVVHIGLVTTFLQTSNKTNIILCSATFYIYMKNYYTFQSQSLKDRLSCIFQAIGNILLQKVQSQHDKHR